MEELFEELEDNGAEIDDALERFMDDEEMYLKYVRAFPGEPTMKSLTAAVEGKDYDAAEKAVHALKGIVNNLGFIPLADATVDMLAELRAGNIPDALEAYGELCDKYEEYCEIINRHCKNM